MILFSQVQGPTTSQAEIEAHSTAFPPAMRLPESHRRRQVLGAEGRHLKGCLFSFFLWISSLLLSYGVSERPVRWNGGALSPSSFVQGLGPTTCLYRTRAHGTALGSV